MSKIFSSRKALYLISLLFLAVALTWGFSSAVKAQQPGQPLEQPAAQQTATPPKVVPGQDQPATAPEGLSGEDQPQVITEEITGEVETEAAPANDQANEAAPEEVQVIEVEARTYPTSCAANAAPQGEQEGLSSFSSVMTSLWQSTGLYGFSCKDKPAALEADTSSSSVSASDNSGGMAQASAPVKKKGIIAHDGIGQLIMICVSLLLLYLAIFKQYEPLLLLTIGMGGLLSNIPIAGISDPGGFLNIIYNGGINNGLFPLLIFMGVGAMTDFGPLIANPRTALLGGAAQFGIFFSLIGALLLTQYVPGIEFSIKDAASIGIIGGADGPTAIFLASRLSPDLLGSIAVAAYSYMALVPIIQPPIMKMLTSEAERNITMKQMRPVSKNEKIIFPIVVILLCAFLLPSAAPLIGALMFGNLAKECGVTNRLSDTMQNALINIVTIMLGLAVGSKLAAERFLTADTLGILLLGLIAFCVGTAAGVLLAKVMNWFSKDNPINPLIGAAGVSAVPMAARVVNNVGLETNPRNFLLMHAMGPNVSGVIGSAVAAGLLLALCGG